MRYQITSLDVSQLPATFRGAAGFDGVAFVLRRDDMPVGFFMQALKPGEEIQPAALAARISACTAAAESEPATYVPPDCALGQISLTIAICTRDRPERLSRCLRSLESALQFASVDNVQILVVDNAPPDQRTRELVRTFESVDYCVEPRPGLDFARNRAVQTARGELIAFVDDDVVVDRIWLRGICDAWSRNPEAGGFAGPVLPYELETEAQIIFEQMGGFGRSFERRIFRREAPGVPGYPCGAGIFGAGCNMVFARAALLELGGFDEALDTGPPLPGGGDLDIFYRVVRAGYTFVREPAILAYHQHRRDWKALRHQMWTWGLGTMAFLRKSWIADPSARPLVMRWTIRWLMWQSLNLFAPFLRRNRRVFVPDLVIAELAGALVGIVGEYSRSQRRIEIIRRQYPAVAQQ